MHNFPIFSAVEIRLKYLHRIRFYIWHVDSVFHRCPFREFTTCSATEIATLIWASSVDAPRCGVIITRSRSISGLSNGGSLTKTSIAAPPTMPSFTAFARASSLIIPPLAR